MFAPDVVRSLLLTHSLFGIGSYVLLDDKSIGRVMRRNKEEYSKPIVKRVLTPHGERISGGSDEHVLDLTEKGIAIARALPTPGSGEVASEALLFRK